MKILVLGADGYLGWPTCMYLANKGHEVLGIDDCSKRFLEIESNSLGLFSENLFGIRYECFKTNFPNANFKILRHDLKDYEKLKDVMNDFKPNTVIHYAAQPSGPYSIKGYKEADYTLMNNLKITHNLIYSIIENNLNTHIIKLGSMGEYGTPNVDIPEGFFEMEYKGRKDTFLFPRQAGSFYHTTKILETDMLYFYVRHFDLKVTDLMQGPVYGFITDETKKDDTLFPTFHYDDIFGTCINRFLIQAIKGIPLTVYGKGDQSRGYLNLIDTLQCVELAALNEHEKGMRIFNQYTEVFSVNQIAQKIKETFEERLNIPVHIDHLSNPRRESEEHYYNSEITQLTNLGLNPHYLTDDVILEMVSKLIRYTSNIDTDLILPRVKWKGK